MSAYRSRLLAWVKGAGIAGWNEMRNDEAVQALRKAGLLERFYQAFPIYDTDADVYVLGD